MVDSSQVYAADVYSEFKGNTLDGKRGQQYRQLILEAGGAKDSLQSLVDFLWREPSVNAFNESMLGLSLE
jgi:metallopeptidase MepB